MKLIIFLSLLLLSIFLSSKSFAVIGQDDRFYIKDTKWSELLNGIVKVGESCTGFVIEGDLVITAAHCVGSIEKEQSNRLLGDYLTQRQIDPKKIKDIKFYFGDSDVSLKNKRIGYEAQYAFLGYSENDSKIFSNEYAQTNDFAIFKTKKPIPKHIKRFKLLSDIDLKNYHILNPHPTRSHPQVSVAGFARDTDKTSYRILAHIGCHMRDFLQFHNNWIVFTDCDISHGQSGGPLFMILKHKETKKIELGVLGLTSSIENKITRRKFDEEKQKDKLGRGRANYRTTFSINYSFSPTCGEDEYSANSVFTFVPNQKGFIKKVEEFRKDPSLFINSKIPTFEKSQYAKFLLAEYLLLGLKNNNESNSGLLLLGSEFFGKKLSKEEIKEERKKILGEHKTIKEFILESTPEEFESLLASFLEEQKRSTGVFVPYSFSQHLEEASYEGLIKGEKEKIYKIYRDKMTENMELYCKHLKKSRNYVTRIPPKSSFRIESLNESRRQKGQSTSFIKPISTQFEDEEEDKQKGAQLWDAYFN